MTSKEHYEKINRLKEIMGFKIPLDGIMMVNFKRPIIDIVALDTKLMKEFNYTGSMNDFIRQKYGEEAILIITNNI